jgi:hypothetical protein
MPDMRGFLSNPGSDWRGVLYICALCVFLTLAQALFVEDRMRSIQQSVQNGQFLCRLAQDASAMPLATADGPMAEAQQPLLHAQQQLNLTGQNHLTGQNLGGERGRPHDQLIRTDLGCTHDPHSVRAAQSMSASLRK